MELFPETTPETTELFPKTTPETTELFPETYMERKKYVYCICSHPILLY